MADQNFRTFYAVQSVAMNGPSGLDAVENDTWNVLNGVQSVGINTNFNLEPIYQLGRLEVYDNYEEIPEVEITLNKVLDGFPTIYQYGMNGDTANTLVQAATKRCGVQLNIYKDTEQGASGELQATLTCVPSYVNSVTYTFPTEGNATEEVTLVSNNKSWVAGGGSSSLPPSISSTGIVRRGLISKNGMVLPTGAGDGDLKLSSVSGGIPSGSIVQNVTISLNLGREQIRELGRRVPVFRYVNFPTEVTCEIQVLANKGDQVGVNDEDVVCSNPKALTDKTIVMTLCDGTVIDLGNKNKLTSVNYTGGDTGGGNATITYSYRTYNEFSYTPPNPATPITE